MKRLLAMAAILAAVAAGALACTDETSGQPTAGTTTQQQTTGNSQLPFPTGSMTTAPTETSGGGGTSPLAGKDPCAVAQPAQQQLNLGNGTASELAGVPHCRFTSTDSVIDVALYLEDGLSNYQGSAKKITIGSHQGLQANDSTGVCTFAIGVTDSSRVEVSAARSDGSDACQLAKTGATAVEPSLPS